MMHSKSSLSRISSSRSVILFVAIAIITTGTIVSGRYFLYATSISSIPHYTYTSILTLLSTISESENIGNLLAAVVAVTGYLLDAYNTRKYKQLETQIERVSCQSRNLLVPITTQFHSLYTISTLQFVDNYLTKDIIQTYIDDHPNYITSIISNLQTIIDSNNAGKNNGTTQSSTDKPNNVVDQFCNQFLELYIHATASGYYEIPESLQHPVSLAFLNEDVLFRRTYEESPPHDDGHDNVGNDDKTHGGADDEEYVVQEPPASIVKVSETTTATRTSASSTNSNSTSSSVRPTLLKSTNDVKKYTTTIQGKKSNTRRPGAITSPQELPNPLHYALSQLTEEEKATTSYLWKSYELFIRNEFVPTVKTIATIIEEHGNIMEPVPPARLQEIYGQTSNGYGQTWNISPRMWFYSMWLSYSKSWDSVLQLWDNGIYTRIRPTVPFPCGILFFNIEAQSIVANAEKKLIGISQMHGYSS